MNASLLIIALLITMRCTFSADLLVFAAASLTDALQEVAANYQKASGTKTRFSFAASSVLARQIQEGARADIFFSADEDKMNQLEERRLVQTGTRRTLLSSSLVIVESKENPRGIRTPADLTKAKRVAIAEPSTVPAGIYARRHLEKLGLWGQIRIIPTENVRAALAAVQGGNADAAIVFKTDAAMSSKVRVGYQFPFDPDLPISYPVTILKEARHPSSAEAFLQYLQSPAAADVFRKFGFIVLPVPNDRPRLQKE